MSSFKQNRPDVSIELIKEVVKKFKSSGFQSLIHHDLAVALSTIGFAEVCKQFGASWTKKQQQNALKILQNSDYDLHWFGNPNNPRYVNFITLCNRGDLQKIKDQLRCFNSDGKKQLRKVVDNYKRTCLHLAVREGYDILTQFLINQGFSLNARDRQLKTPLHYCTQELICQVLLKNKAKVIVKDNRSCTPVHYAATRSDYRCLQLMLKNSNVVNQPDAEHKTPIFYAVFNTTQEQVNIFRILLENGAKVNQKDIFGKTALHYAAELGKSRCIPILLQKGASTDARDKHNKTPLDLANNEKIKKIILAYCQNKGMMFQRQQTEKRKQYEQISEKNSKSQNEMSKIIKNNKSKVNSQIYTKQINQVSTWIRQKFFVLMKKLQQSGIKACWHAKRPYVYTGSWAEDIDGLQDLYQIFLNVNGPEAAMRTFNILCPYQKQFPSVMGRSEEAFQSFFGENWFSTDPIEKVRNMHSTSKIRTQYQQKVKQNEDLTTQLLGYKSQIQSLQNKISSYHDELNQYKKIEDQLRKQRNKNTQQYSQILKLMNQNQQLKAEIDNLVGGEEKTKILSTVVQDLKSKNKYLQQQIIKIRQVQAASRRKCGQVFLKTLSMAQNTQFSVPNQENMYDDDAIINLYNLLKNNPPNLQKRFSLCDKRAVGKLNIDEFTKMLQQLSMLPQDVISMHRITGFAFGRKFVSLQEFKTILENRHKNRPMWQKKLITKIKNIILQNGLTLDKFFLVMDKDGNGTIQATQLRKGLENHNIFMNQNDWSNLFNLLDSDRSGEIDLEELKQLMEQQRTGRLKYLEQQQQAQQNDQGQNNEQDEQAKQQNKQQQKQPQKSQVQSSEVRQSEQPQFSQPYSEKDSEQQGFSRLSGVLKIQLRALKYKSHPDIKKLYAKFFIHQDIDSDDGIKMVDLTQSQKLDIATQIKLIQYKILEGQPLRLNVSFWQTRQFNEQNYLGQQYIQLKKVFDNAGQWAINDKFKIEPDTYQKQIKGAMLLQIKWNSQEQ